MSGRGGRRTARDRKGIAAARQQTRLVRRLREIRIGRGKSVQEVADELGVDPSMIYRFEKGGTNPTLATIRKYALAVDASLILDAEPAEMAEFNPALKHAAGQTRVASTQFAVSSSEMPAWARQQSSPWVELPAGRQRSTGIDLSQVAGS